MLGLDGPVSSDVEALTDGNMSWMPLTGATTSFKPLCPWPKWSLCGCGWPGNSSCNEGSNLRLSRDDEVVSDAVGALKVQGDVHSIVLLLAQTMTGAVVSTTRIICVQDD